jgi:hypothetical protein
MRVPATEKTKHLNLLEVWSIDMATWYRIGQVMTLHDAHGAAVNPPVVGRREGSIDKELGRGQK